MMILLVFFFLFLGTGRCLVAFLGSGIFFGGSGHFSFFLVLLFLLRDLDLRQSHSLRNLLVNQYKILFYTFSVEIVVFSLEVVCRMSNIESPSETSARKPGPR
jgi:hypothetical protein